METSRIIACEHHVLHNYSKMMFRRRLYKRSLVIALPKLCGNMKEWQFSKSRWHQTFWLLEVWARNCILNRAFRLLKGTFLGHPVLVSQCQYSLPFSVAMVEQLTLLSTFVPLETYLLAVMTLRRRMKKYWKALNWKTCSSVFSIIPWLSVYWLYCTMSCILKRKFNFRVITKISLGDNYMYYTVLHFPLIRPHSGIEGRFKWLYSLYN